MNLPGPLRDELFALGNEATAMVQRGLHAAEDLAETIGGAIPYVCIVLMVVLLSKYGIEEGIRIFKDTYIDNDAVGEDNINI